jgi:hypothetical protein
LAYTYGSKRQYIHILQKWGIEKNHTRKSKTKHDLSPGSLADTESAMGVDHGLSPATHVLASLDIPTGADSNAMVRQWIQEQPAEISQESYSHEADDVAWPEEQSPCATQQPTVQVDGSFTHDREMLAAEFCFALSDDRRALSSFRAVYKAVRKQGALSPSFAIKLTINCSRCMQTTEEAPGVRRMITEHFGHPFASSGTGDRFLFWTLYVRTLDTTTEKSCDEDTARRVHQIVESSIRGGRLDVLPQCGQVLDLVTLQCLDYILSRYNDNLSAGRAIDVNNFLRQFIRQQGHNAGNQRDSSCMDVACVRSCLQWCTRKLKEGRQLPGIFHEMPPQHDSSIEVYRQDLEVFAYLWHSWRASKSTGDESTSNWDKTVETELGISATELLSTITWMLTAAAPPAPVEAADTDELLTRAAEGASIIATLDDAVLLGNFVERFLCMNKVVQTPLTEREFRDLALVRLRSFAETVLDVRIPSLDTGAEDAVPDISPSMTATFRLSPCVGVTPAAGTLVSQRVGQHDFVEDPESSSWNGTLSDGEESVDSSVA